jgi:hypothetical protein
MTGLSDAIARRDDATARYFKDYLKVDNARGDFRAFAMSDLGDYTRPERRLGIGVAFSEAAGGDLGLALRVRKTQGVAYRAALDIAKDAEKDGSWADIRVVERIAVPANQEVKPIDEEVVNRGVFPICGDPLVIGASVGHPKGPTGSLGGFVKIRGRGEGIIGACHVLANGGRGINLTEDDAPNIYHPGRKDAQTITALDIIGNLVNYGPLDTNSVEVDCAVGTLRKNWNHSGNQIPQIPGAKGAGTAILEPPKSLEPIAAIKKVAKIGRTTGYTEGRLSAGFFNDVGLDVPGHGLVYYNRLFEIESEEPQAPFAGPGDSGAVVFDLAARFAFAMIVGGGEWDDKGRIRTLVYGCSLASALKAMRAEWL